MSITYWLLVGLSVAAIGMCVWALVTGGPGPDQRHEDARAVRKHSREDRGATTQRLGPRPPADFWLPPMERPGGMVQRLPAKEELPWVD